MQQQSPQQPPFAVRILDLQPNGVNVDKSQPDKAKLSSLLPASYLTKNDDLAPPNLDELKHIEQELGVGRLGQPPIPTWLWIAGRPVPPRALHHQLVLGREIMIVEQMDLHLVWTSGRMFLKPIPRYLLEPSFWTDCLACEGHPPCNQATDSLCDRRKLWKCALGFLFSYVALIRYESDFLLAQERHLIPAEARWHGWRKLVMELDTEHIYGEIDTRYIYGELRLSRLNKIQYLHVAFRGYMASWRRYGDFFYDNFTWLASATVYIAIVLTAMQVGLGTDVLGKNQAFQAASYGFTVFSIVGPLAAVGLIICIFFYIFVSNWVATVRYRKRRLPHVRGKP
ncbi:hypothetical protein GGS24DRAFT_477556 [Hypoxylon argillaceum]|nr:hypothetical protein GGS24DRAFT_477556 [Hypoxylon argillaceum]